MASWELFVDGSSKHGTGYFGYVLFRDKVQIDSGYGMIGRDVKPKTAEKYAILYGLDGFARKWSEPGSLKVFGDAKQVIDSVENDPDIRPKVDKIRGWGVPVTFKWIARDKNTLANDLARKMIDYFRIAGKGPKIER
jgi:ribonuclease HI